ncbi:hypothetical protein HBI56_031910 [Parastagonospora nodorum]|uniref:Uncharacterized protein n=1 Tax=Phaeosphaeria nodorum (strain SN15 / ATCC MYA-4574 / FGSC 10173) TaxID=321614 RepID=A0A7U2EZ34_PHANO|nr:hypothetical protein HBH56_019620 [Parastagonospora nodorum]QRC95362.1 hypothetical protein JI435_407220 [Parastagonospora nodorum SN15]KAH3937338.1 hypothetical protein HBH54_014880 [Parastagonospora nodorum]KAH3953680.1 hypothetical protein HBH53_027030 [Parastagonospora nodorum]KAH3962713.1 hypothetical protein HBH51_174770 [Parastagonospora nodorum]
MISTNAKQCSAATARPPPTFGLPDHPVFDIETRPSASPDPSPYHATVQNGRYRAVPTVDFAYTTHAIEI